MNIIEDTRQKPEKHVWKNDYWKEHGDSVLRCALPVGDYQLAPDIVCDSKNGIQEIAQNLCGKVSEKERVKREESRAADLGIKLFFVIEQDGITCKEDLIPLQLVLPSNQIVLGEQLKAAMEIHEHKYGSEFVFCKPSESGKVIKEILSHSKLNT